MKNAYEVLQQKEEELTRVRREIASLRIVAPLLSTNPPVENSNREEQSQNTAARTESEGTGTDGFSTFAAVSRPKIWNVLKRGKQD